MRPPTPQEEAARDLCRVREDAKQDRMRCLVPSEASSGERQRRGAITKAGNGHARKLMIEAAWHARHKPSIPEALRQRRRGQPPEIIAMADVAQQRLHRRYGRLVQRGKPTTVAATAVARELVGFVWAALRAVA